MSTIKRWKNTFALVGTLFLIMILIIGITVPAYAQTPNRTAVGTSVGEQKIVTKQSITIEQTEVRDIPSENGEIVETLRSGSPVNIYMTNISGAWNAIVMDNGDIRYIATDATAITAPPYVYTYGSDLTRITAYSAEQLESLLHGTGLEGLGEIFAEMESTRGVNALFLIGITKQESGNGTSSLARRQNNLGGLKNGRGGYMSFDSKADCVRYMADLLSEKYLTEGGRLYSGKTVQAVAKRYCEQSSSWTAAIESFIKSGYNKIQNAS